MSSASRPHGALSRVHLLGAQQRNIEEVRRGQSPAQRGRTPSRRRCGSAWAIGLGATVHWWRHEAAAPHWADVDEHGHGRSGIGLRGPWRTQVVGVASATNAVHTRWRAADSLWPPASPSTVLRPARNGSVIAAVGRTSRQLACSWRVKSPTTLSSATWRLSTSMAVRSRSPWIPREWPPRYPNHLARFTFGDRKLEADREVEFLGVAGGEPQLSARHLEHREPGRGGARLIALRQDQPVHLRGDLAGGHRRRILRAGT